VKHYLAIHDHEYGRTVYRFTSSEDESLLYDEENQAEIATQLAIKFEPTKGERLDIQPLGSVVGNVV